MYLLLFLKMSNINREKYDNILKVTIVAGYFTTQGGAQKMDSRKLPSPLKTMSFKGYTPETIFEIYKNKSHASRSVVCPNTILRVWCRITQSGVVTTELP